MTEWVTIIKINFKRWKLDNEELKYYSQFIKRSFPVIDTQNVSREGVKRNEVLLPIKSHLDDDDNTWWSEDEVRLATKKEIRLAELELGAEKI